MKKFKMTFPLLAAMAGCSAPSQSKFERTPLPMESSTGDDPDDDPVAETSKPADQESTPAPDKAASETKPTPTPTPAPAAEFVVDPDTLSFPVVFHMGGSGVWQNEDKLKPVVAEAQRILQQAKIEIIPTYTKDMNTTDNLDVFFVPQIPNQPGVNGISYGGGAVLEVYVIDNVGLNKVDDQRPAEALAPRYFKGAKPGDKVPVAADEAEQGRTTAHEISHQLGLPHRQNTTNLMASGTTGWTLNAEEIAIVRKTAVDKFKAKFVKTLP